MLGHIVASTPGPPADQSRRQLSLPQLPFKRPAMAFDDGSTYPYAGYLGGVGGQTVAGQLAFGLYFPGYPYLAELSQRSEYRQPVETTAKEMTREWIKITSKGDGDKSDLIAQIEKAFEQHGVQLLFRKVTEHDGFYGLGMVYIKLRGDEGAIRKLPLAVKEGGIEQGQLEGFNTIEPMWITPITWNSNDPTIPTFYNPEQWVVLGQSVHASRLLKFISREVPDIIKPAYNFGGLSLTQLIDPYVQRWLKTVDSVSRLISNFSIITLATDMATVLQGGDPAAYQALLDRLKLFTKNRDNQGIFLHDKDDELLSQVQASLTGLGELQGQALEHMAYPTHQPLIIMTGVSPAGLNATSEGEIEVWHNWVHSMQEQLYRPPLEIILKVVQLDLNGKIDPDITFEFKPLKEVAGSEVAEVRKATMETLVAAVDSGIIDGHEARDHLASDPDSGFNSIDVDKVIEPPDLESEGVEEEVRISA
jgi:hypothetical protein